MYAIRSYYGQYDHQVRDGSVVLPGSDAAVIRIKSDSLPVMSADLESKVAGFSFFERLLSMWHILHMPLFVMLLIAGIVHVYAVHMY